MIARQKQAMRAMQWFCIGAMLAALFACQFLQPAHAQVRVPEVSATYRLKLQREVASHFGLNAPVARVAAQIHQESAWNPRAASKYAQGLSQFTPSTAKWLPAVCPGVGPPDVWDTDWSLRAIACYDAWLYHRLYPIGPPSMTECSRWAFTLRGYNGGEGWLKRERKLAQSRGANANDWQAVAHHRVRAGWAHKENTGYPRRILLLIEPAYRAAGWPGHADC